MLCDFQTIVECAGRGGTDPVVTVLRAGNGIVKPSKGLAHEIPVWGTGFYLSATCVAVANANNAWHINLPYKRR